MMTPIIATSIIAGTLAYLVGAFLDRGFAAFFALWAATAIPIIAFA